MQPRTIATTAGAIASFGASYLLHQESKRVDDDKQKFFSNITEFQDFAQLRDNDRLILQFSQTTNNGFICIKKQVINQRTKIVPAESYQINLNMNGNVSTSVGAGFVTIKESVIEFEKVNIFMRDASFGTNILVPKSISNAGYVDLDELEITDRKKADGATIKKILMGKYKVRSDCVAKMTDDDIYEYIYYDLKEKPIYFIGTKIKSKFHYDYFTINPESMVRREYSGEDFVYSFGKVALCIIGTGLLVSPILSKL
jgi:hypothetical protein